MIAKLVSFILGPICVLSLRLTGIDYFKKFTLKLYNQAYPQAQGRNLVWVQIEGTFINFLLAVLAVIPEWLATFLKQSAGHVVINFMPSYRKVIETNLEIAFKERYSSAERKKLARRSFIHSIDSLIWLLEISTLNQKEVMRRTKVTGFRNLEAAIKKGKGVILCAPHYSRFLYPAFYAGLGNNLPVNFIIRRIDNPLFGEAAYLMLHNLSMEVIIRSHWALKKGLYALKRGEVLFLLMDQNVAVGGMFVPFFGVPATTFKGVHYLHQRTEAAVICCHGGYRNGFYEVEYSPEITGEALEGEALLLEKINLYFEEAISRDPEKHLWMHPRWKKRPPGEETLYPQVKNLHKL